MINNIDKNINNKENNIVNEKENNNNIEINKDINLNQEISDKNIDEKLKLEKINHLSETKEQYKKENKKEENKKENENQEKKEDENKKKGENEKKEEDKNEIKDPQQVSEKKMEEDGTIYWGLMGTMLLMMVPFGGAFAFILTPLQAGSILLVPFNKPLYKEVEQNLPAPMKDQLITDKGIDNLVENPDKLKENEEKLKKAIKDNPEQFKKAVENAKNKCLKEIGDLDLVNVEHDINSIKIDTSKNKLNSVSVKGKSNNDVDIKFATKQQTEELINKIKELNKNKLNNVSVKKDTIKNENKLNTVSVKKINDDSKSEPKINNYLNEKDKKISPFANIKNNNGNKINYLSIKKKNKDNQLNI